MASRKEQKEQARAARIAQEQEAVAKAQRNRRLQIFGGAIAIAVIVIVVAIVVSSGGNKSNPLQHGSKLTATYKAVNSELANIPESGSVLGKPSAKVTLFYWGDLQCPICQEFTLGQDGGGLPQFIKNDVRSGKAKVDYESLCTATCSPSNPTGGMKVFNMQQSAAYAAGKQNLAWYYIEMFYREQGTEDSGYATNAFIKAIGTQIPKLNLETWTPLIGSSTFVKQVKTSQSLGIQKYNFNSTPSFAISGPKGTASLGAAVLTYSDLERAVKAVS